MTHGTTGTPLDLLDRNQLEVLIVREADLLAQAVEASVPEEERTAKVSHDELVARILADLVTEVAWVTTRDEVAGGMTQ